MAQLRRRQVLTGLSTAALAGLLAGEHRAQGRPAAGDGRLITLPFVAGEEGYSCYRTPGLAVSGQGTVLAFCGGRVDNCR
ncbi:MAG: hypothetical protein ACKO8I_04420, partial [Cyanobacteriota bacterium]